MPTCALPTFHLYVLLTQAHCRRPILEAARAVIEGGADVVQLREKELSDRELLRLGRMLREMTARAGVKFIFNDRPDLARLVEADGVHLGQDDLPADAARRVLGRGQILGISTHSVKQARRAVADGADYIGVGPMYPTATKGYTEGVGLDYLHAAAETVRVPLIAIGGITPPRVAAICEAAPGRVGVAICAAILGADDIAAATREFRIALDNSLR